MKRLSILVKIISILGAYASIIWLFFEPGIEIFIVSISALTTIIGFAVPAQVKLAKVLDEYISKRLLSIKKIRKVTNSIPRVTENELFIKLENENAFCSSLTSRLVRIFGLRRELIPIIEPELISLIDDELEPLFNIGVGKCTLKDDKLKQFAVVALKLYEMVQVIENKLVQKHRKRFDFS